MDVENEGQLRNWINGNYSSLDREDLFALIKYFEAKTKELEA
jgi:uncharacterized protein (DUF433 family)